MRAVRPAAPVAGSTATTTPSSRSSTTSRPSTTPAGDTPPLARSPRLPSRRTTATQALQPDHGRSQPVSTKPGQLHGAVGADVDELDEVLHLIVGQFRLLAAQGSLRL